MLKKINMIIIALLTIIIILSILPLNTSKALTDPITNPDAYRPGTNDKSNSLKFVEMGVDITNAIRTIGTIAAVIAIMVIGIKYMMGSTADKANYKETMIPYIIGAFMLFAIPTVINIIYKAIMALKY